MKRMKMTNLGKRVAVLSTVLLMVCSAVYLNWRYADGVSDVGKVLGQSTLVNAEIGRAHV